MTMTPTSSSLPRPSEIAPKVAAFRSRVFHRLAPPVSIQLAEWADKSVSLPAVRNVRPGPYRTLPYFVEIFDAIGSSELEYVTVMKGSRLGYTTALMIGIAATAAINPCSIGLVVPNDEHAREYALDELEPILRASPALRDMLVEGRLLGRNTMTRKRFRSGASLKILSARAPATLRRHDFKTLYLDEVDAFELTSEGDAITLAEKRTFAHGDRKIVRGSTPTIEEVSAIERLYNESDQRVYEIACPHCEDWFELLWEHIQWPADEPEKATAFCPSCGCQIDESLKTELVERGRWRALRPEVKGHAGFRINALVAPLRNAAWPRLAADYLRAKRAGPIEMQPFFNHVLAKTWRTTSNKLSPEGLEARAEPIGLDRIPEEVVLLTCGADVQNDRIEATVLGWPVSGAPCALGHVVINGDTHHDEVWGNFDAFLRRKWLHPNGWEMRIDATAVDSGGNEGHTQAVYNFCGPRLSRRIYAIAGRAGPRPIWAPSQRIKTGKSARLFILGHDEIKRSVFALLDQPQFIGSERNPQALRVSDDLEPSWFEQVTNEVVRIKYIGNRAVQEFTLRTRGARVEALDAVCYAWAVRQSPAVKAIDLRARAARRPPPPPPEDGAPPPPPSKPRSKFASWAAHFNG